MIGSPLSLLRWLGRAGRVFAGARAVPVLTGLLLALPVAAADLGPLAGTPPVGEGLACEDPAVGAFPSVWQGHFTGGYSHALGPGLPVALDWRDETLCFPSRRACNGYMRVMRRDFHRPEGYFTCLPIR